jgi:hypothetical protein
VGPVAEAVTVGVAAEAVGAEDVGAIGAGVGMAGVAGVIGAMGVDIGATGVEGTVGVGVTEVKVDIGVEGGAGGVIEIGFKGVGAMGAAPKPSSALLRSC